MNIQPYSLASQSKKSVRMLEVISFADRHDDKIRKVISKNNNNNACQNKYLALLYSTENSK